MKGIALILVLLCVLPATSMAWNDYDYVNGCSVEITKRILSEAELQKRSMTGTQVNQIC